MSLLQDVELKTVEKESIDVQSSHDLLVNTISTCKQHRGSIKAQKLKKGGTLYARLQKPPRRNAGALALVLRGHKLKNVEGLFKKSDPFYEIRRTYDGPNSGSWNVVYRSKHVQDNLSPVWQPATVDVNALCDGDLDRKIQVAVYDHESSGKHESMGQFETTGEFACLLIIWPSVRNELILLYCNH